MGGPAQERREAIAGVIVRRLDASHGDGRLQTGTADGPRHGRAVKAEFPDFGDELALVIIAGLAIEFQSTLPLDEVEVLMLMLMLTDILDPATGHIAGLPVLYVRVAEQALRAVNLGRTDACALVEHLGGHMS